MSRDLLCPKCRVEGTKLSGQSTLYRFCGDHGLYHIYDSCTGCYWHKDGDGNKRAWPCHKCKDNSCFTKDAKNYPDNCGAMTE